MISHRSQIRRSLAKIRAITAQIDPKFRGKHDAWMSQELQALTEAIGIKAELSVLTHNNHYVKCKNGSVASDPGTPGEGVEELGVTPNMNQFQPEAKISQCALEALEQDVPRPIVEMFKTGKEPTITSTSYKDGSVASYSHSKGLGGVVKEDGGADLVKVEKEPVGAKEWPGESRVKIMSYCPNPRLCRGGLIEEGGRVGRMVSVWQGRFKLVPGNVYDCKLDFLQGSDARYLPV